jgi:hypothetical protein
MVNMFKVHLNVLAIHCMVAKTMTLFMQIFLLKMYPKTNTDYLNYTVLVKYEVCL